MRARSVEILRWEQWERINTTYPHQAAPSHRYMYVPVFSIHAIQVPYIIQCHRIYYLINFWQQIFLLLIQVRALAP